MSASSQNTGNIRLVKTITVTNGVTLAGYVEVNAFDKTTYGTLCVIELPAADTAYRGVGIQQDPTGAGTADNYKGFWYDGSAGFTATNNIVTTAGLWRWVAIVVSGTSNATADFYWGGETGALTNEQLTTNFSAAVLTQAVLASDFVNEHSNNSYRGWRLWTAALNSTEITAERDSKDFSPVRTSNLVSDIRLVNGTNPEVATTGTDWTRTGTWVDDASNPTFPGSEVPLEHFSAQRALRNVHIRL